MKRLYIMLLFPITAVLCAVWGLNLSSWPAALAQQAQTKGNVPRDEIEAKEKDEDDFSADWRLLLFGREQADRERKITKIIFSLVDMKSSPFKKSGIAEERGLVYETNDPLILQTIELGFARPLKYAVPDKGYGAGSSIFSVGHMEVFTNEGNFIVGITQGGFVLEQKEYVIQRAFFSWAVAKQLDDILFSERKLHIPKEVFEGLSSESNLNGDRHTYDMLRRK